MENQAICAADGQLFFVAHTALETHTTGYLYQPDKQPRGFYQLYQIDVGNQNDGSSSDRDSNTSGLNSPFGSRGAICAHFHWPYEYLQWGIRWGIVQRMLADAPQYHYDTDTKGKPKNLKQAKKLSNKNAKEMMAYFNSLHGG